MYLSGRVCLVTGAGSGLGAVIARTLGAAQAKVVVVDVDADAAGTVADDLARRGGEALPIAADICDERAIEVVVRQSHDWGGGLDVLVNNAGGWSAGPGQIPHVSRQRLVGRP